MTDRELLELAAKAAGIEIWSGQRDQSGTLFRSAPSGDGKFGGVEWNPLADDGDALRLAIKLQLTVGNEHLRAGCAYCTDGDDTTYPTVWSGTNEDSVLPEDYAATRRAIVLAAAQIGQELVTKTES